MFLLSFCFAFTVWGNTSEKIKSDHTEATLIADHKVISPGQVFTVALHLNMDEHWHTYWQNPGDSGFSTSIDWTLPEGFEAGDLQWPAPKEYLVSGIKSFVYEGEVSLLTEITAPDTLPVNTSVVIAAEVSWLECKEVCLPGGGELSLTLKTADKPILDAEALKRFQPIPAVSISTSVYDVVDGHVVLKYVSDQTTPPAFFPISERVFLIESDYDVSLFERGVEIQWKKHPEAKNLPKTIKGVLVWEDQAEEIHFTSGSVDLGEAVEDVAPTQSSPFTWSALFRNILLAFLGGIVLNLMPCVFPVISIKVLGFVQQAEEGKSHVLKHGLAFTTGVLLSFWALALLIISLKVFLETQVGFGFQLQEAWVNALLACLFTFMAVNLFGVFEVGTSLTGTGDELMRKSGLSGSFFSGLLATVVATPCMAPMMGGAIGFAFQYQGFVIFLIFTALGLGMALPYVLLTMSEKLRNKLPKPGAWMETFKQTLGFFFLATVIWLIFVFVSLTDAHRLVDLLLGLLILSIGGWVYGRWGALHKTPKTRRIGITLGILLMLAGTLHAVVRGGTDWGKPTDAIVQWEPWSADAVTDALAEGNHVFVDYTAAWCLSCQANKKSTLQQESVRKAFLENGVKTFVADWTKKDDDIRKSLENFGRSGVPVYVLYDGKTGDYTLLPEILTPPIVLNKLKTLNERK